MSQMTDRAPDGADGLFARARTGDQAAWKALVDTCNPKVLRAIRRRLTQPSMRSLYDSTDFMGDVWRSLYEKPDKYDFPTFGHLVSYLAIAAERKVIDEHRRLRAQRNDRGRDRPLSGSDVPGGGDLPSSDPTASQIAQEGEARERLRRGLGPDEQMVVDLKGEGYSNDEIAARSGWHVRKVQRFLKDLADAWAPRAGDGGQA